jgi:sarcosine oxidase gamma subunit
MAELRAAHITDEKPEDRARLRALAREFPGALRELDSLAADEIDRRALALEQAAAGLAPEAWMVWMCHYHALMRAALLLRARPSVSPAGLAEIAAETGAPVDDAFAAQVARPPHGRLMAAVFDRLSLELGAPARVLWDTLFPSRKGPRGYRQR